MSSTVAIVEQGGLGRSVVLQAASLPFAGVPFGGDATLATQWYPGNTRATQQVLGPKENDSTWTGIWRTTQLLRSPVRAVLAKDAPPSFLTVAYALVDAIDDLRRSGALLEVTWASSSIAGPGAVPQRSHRVVRYGRISSFTPTYRTIDDVEWSITFSWIGRESSTARLQNATVDVTAAIQAAISASAGAVAKVRDDSLRTAADTWSLGDLEAVADAPLAMVDQFAQAAESVSSRAKSVGDLIRQTRALPSAILSRVVEVANNGLSVATEFLDAMSREAPETWTAEGRVSMFVRTCSYFSGAQSEASYLAEQNATLRDTATRRQSTRVTGGGASAAISEILAVRRARPGDTWIGLSRRYYGDDSKASQLARANGRRDWEISPPAGIIVIPTLAALGG